MSTPIGSKIITNIDTINFNYLIGNTNGDVTVGTWDSNDWNTKGQPKFNLDLTEITEELLLDLKSALPERNTVNTTIFEDYPTLDSGAPTDFTISSSTDLHATFIDEGAGYKNAFGYYFYTIIDGVKHLLSNGDDNINSNLGYYNPTIVFPNTSKKNKGVSSSKGTLAHGSKRKLLGNNANKQFENINVGFFVVSNGWNSDNVGVKYNNKRIIHSTKDFNHNYVFGSNNVDENGCQSIIFNNGSSEFILCFEDIERPSGDGDFNDLIIKIESSNTVDTTGIIILNNVQVPSDLLKFDYYGSFISFSISNFTNLSNINRKYCFTRTMNFSNKTKRDYYIDILTYIVHALSYELTILNDNVIKIKYCFTKTEIDANTYEDKLKLYTLKKSDNENDDTIVDIDENKTIYDKLVDIQHLENDMTVVTQDNTIVETDIVDPNINITLLSETNIIPLNLTNNVLAWGDPHIKLLSGKYITLPNTKSIFNLITTKNDELIVNIDCDFYPDHPIKAYKDTTYIKYVSFCSTKNGINENIFIDLFNNLNVYELVNGKLMSVVTQQYKNIKIHDINECSNVIDNIKFTHLSSKDRDILIRIITVNNIDFWCMVYPNMPEYLNEIFINNTNINLLYTDDMYGILKDGYDAKYIVNK